MADQQLGVEETIHGAEEIRLGAVDDHPFILSGLRAELARLDPAITYVVDAMDVAGLLGSGFLLDVVLLDLRLNDGSRPRDNVSTLLAAGARVLIYTEGATRSLIGEALRAGAHGVLRKDRSPAEVVEAIRAVAHGETFENEEVAQALEAVSDLRPQLSERERQALALYASGLPAKLVARQLGVGLETAREYLRRVRAKYAALERPAYTRMDLYRRAVEDGFVDPVLGE